MSILSEIYLLNKKGSIFDILFYFLRSAIEGNWSACPFLHFFFAQPARVSVGILRGFSLFFWVEKI